MPTYEYKCKKCGNEFEVIQKMSDEPLKACVIENCDGVIFRKISKNVGLVFNGKGFYITDYTNKSSSSTTKPLKESSQSESAPSTKESTVKTA